MQNINVFWWLPLVIIVFRCIPVILHPNTPGKKFCTIVVSDKLCHDQKLLHLMFKTIVLKKSIQKQLDECQIEI